MSLQTAIFNSTIFKAISSAIGFLSFSALSFFVAVFFTALAHSWINDKPAAVFDTVYSPDGKLKAVVFGDEKCPEYKNVSVLSAKAILEKDRDGNVLSESCYWVGAKWIDNQRLVIYRDGDRLANRKSENFIAFDRGIDVDYRVLKGQ